MTKGQKIESGILVLLLILAFLSDKRLIPGFVTYGLFSVAAVYFFPVKIWQEVLKKHRNMDVILSDFIISLVLALFVVVHFNRTGAEIPFKIVMIVNFIFMLYYSLKYPAGYKESRKYGLLGLHIILLFFAGFV